MKLEKYRQKSIPKGNLTSGSPNDQILSVIPVFFLFIKILVFLESFVKMKISLISKQTESDEKACYMESDISGVASQL